MWIMMRTKYENYAKTTNSYYCKVVKNIANILHETDASSCFDNDKLLRKSINFNIFFGGGDKRHTLCSSKGQIAK